MRSKTSMHQPMAAKPRQDANWSDDNLNNFTIATKSEFETKNDDAGGLAASPLASPGRQIEAKVEKME